MAERPRPDQIQSSSAHADRESIGAVIFRKPVDFRCSRTWRKGRIDDINIERDVGPSASNDCMDLLQDVLKVAAMQLLSRHHSCPEFQSLRVILWTSRRTANPELHRDLSINQPFLSDALIRKCPDCRADQNTRCPKCPDEHRSESRPADRIAWHGHAVAASSMAR